MFLNCHTYYSFNYGLLSPKQLVELGVRHQVSALALTDINNTSCAIEFYQLCREADIKPVLGIEFRQHGSLRYIGLARNQQGLSMLHALLNSMTVGGKDLPVRPSLEQCIIIYDRLPCHLNSLMEHEYLGVRASEIHAKNSSLDRRSRQKLLAWQPVTLVNPSQYDIHRLLQCIDQNTLFGQQRDCPISTPGDCLLPPAEMFEKFKTAPWLLINAQKVLASTDLQLIIGPAVNRSTYGQNVKADIQKLHQLVWQGRRSRYPARHPSVDRRLYHELHLIEKLHLQTYFLTTWDIVTFASTRHFPHVGRGSGANSAVAYCLYITDVDPIELNLYFERFINPHRQQPPDFDLDFSHRDRDTIWRYVFDKYGHDRVGLLGTYQTYKGRSLVRRIGSAFGLSRSDQDQIVRAPWDDHHPLAKRIFEVGHKLRKLPSHLSMHVGGLVIGQRSMTYTTAKQMMPKGFAVTHMDMHHAAAWGYHKYDLLSQRGLSHVRAAVDLVKDTKGTVVDIHDMAMIKQDSRTLSLLASGQSMGCFYIESPAMRGLLQQLRCSDYFQLITACSIIRPGVAKSGMMKAYIERHHSSRPLLDVHPLFASHLADTYGVMVYQEDVMKMVHLFAGLNLHDADLLRRLMTGKSKSRADLKALRTKFMVQAVQLGHSQTLVREVWRQIESFSGYAFCKAHSASYAAESMQSLYLKAHYPWQFITAVIDCRGGFYSTEFYIHEARRLGATVVPPCINRSGHHSVLHGHQIFLGYKHVKNLRLRSIGQIAQARADGPFTSFSDFLERVQLPFSQLEVLIRIGAFRFDKPIKAALYWEALYDGKPTTSQSLFPKHTLIAPLPNDQKQVGTHDQHYEEIDLLGYPLCAPFLLIDRPLPEDRIVTKDLQAWRGKCVTMVGYYVAKKPVTTVRGKHMCFATWMDEHDDFFDSIHFPTALQQHPLHGRGFYILRGKIATTGDHAMLEVYSAQQLCPITPQIADLPNT